MTTCSSTSRANRHTFLTINNAYYCPEISANLISLGQLARNDCMTTQIRLNITVYDLAFNPILFTRCEDNVSTINSPRFSHGILLSTWHKRLGHASYKYIQKTSDRINIVKKDKPFCEPCTKGKQHHVYLE